MSSTNRDEQVDSADGGIKPLAAFDPVRIGPFLLLGRLGAGGMGRVFLARSESGRTVAVKVVHEEHVSDERFRARFRREIDAAQRVGERYRLHSQCSGATAGVKRIMGWRSGAVLWAAERTNAS